MRKKSKSVESGQELPEVIAYLDVFERDLAGMIVKVREYRYELSAKLKAAGLDES